MLGEYLRRALASLTAPSTYEPVVGLRALAMLWVIWFHSVTTAIDGALSRDGSIKRLDLVDGVVGERLAQQWWWVSLAMTGDGGVDLFLVLSGFLLGGMLMSELRAHGRVDVVRFYVRRFFRIEPAFASSILIQMACIPAARSPGQCPALWWSNLLFIHNIWPVQGFLFGPAYASKPQTLERRRLRAGRDLMRPRAALNRVWHVRL